MSINPSHHHKIPNLSPNSDSDDPFASSAAEVETTAHTTSTADTFSDKNRLKNSDMQNSRIEDKETVNAAVRPKNETTLLKPYPTDSVFILALKVDAIIGVYEWEQAITQPLIFDIEMCASQQMAAHSDDINDAINYKIVCERVAQLSKTSKVALLERLAQLVADMILQEFNADSVVVTIHKPTAIKHAASVGVKIHRARPI